MPQATTPSLTPDQGYATVVQKLYVPAFIEKLAEYDIKIETEAQLQDALARAAQLRELYNADQQKQAAAKTDELSAFGQHLDQTLQSHGLLQTGPSPQIFKQAASRGAADPELANAILCMAAGQAAA